MRQRGVVPPYRLFPDCDALGSTVVCVGGFVLGISQLVPEVLTLMTGIFVLPIQQFPSSAASAHYDLNWYQNIGCIRHGLMPCG